MKNNIFGEYTTLHDAINEAWRYASGQADKQCEINSLKRQITQAQQKYDHNGDLYWLEQVELLFEKLFELEAEGGVQ